MSASDRTSWAAGIHDALNAWLATESELVIAEQAAMLGIDVESVRDQLAWVVRHRCAPAGIDAMLQRECAGMSRDAVRAALPARILHLAASGVPGLALESVVTTAVLGSESWCPPSRHDLILPAFVDYLTREAPELPQHIQCCDAAAGYDWCDAAVVFGSDETIALVQSRLGDRPVVGYGSRTGIAVVDAGATNWADGIADDIARFRQAGCMSPRVVYAIASAREVRDTLSVALERAVAAHVTAIDSYEARRTSDAAALQALTSGSAATVAAGPCSVQLVDIGSDQDLLAALPEPDLLQTAVVAASPERFTVLAGLLEDAGCTRTVAPGEAHTPRADWPHDGIGRIAPLMAAHRVAAPSSSAR